MTRSACAKVLLLGEHSVVYGHGAIALGLPHGLTARAELPLPNASPREELLRVDRWGLLCSSVQENHLVARAFGILLEAFSLRGSGVHVTVEAHIPAGVGLGSSAALAIAISRELGALTETPLDFDALFELGMQAERVFHGNPSGIDHTVSTLGGALWLRRQQGTLLPPETVALVEPLELVVVVAAPGASTKEMVEGVRRRYDARTPSMTPLLQAMGALAIEGRDALERADLSALGEIMDMNHGLLVSIGVSTDALDDACHTARAAGALGAKLTGAGGGGCILALAPGCQNEVARVFRERGMEVLCPTITP